MDLKIKEDYNLFLNFNRLFSYPKIWFYMLIGARGTGKTTGLLIKLLKHYAKTGRRFIILKRYVPELKSMLSIFDYILDGVTTKSLTKGVYAYVWQKQEIGYLIALSRQQKIKSALQDRFMFIDYFMCDEWFLLRSVGNTYLTNEVANLLEFVSTVVRLRTDYKVFIMSNNTDILNPYFTFFNIKQLKLGEIYKDDDKGLYVEMIPNNPALLDREKETPLYRLTQGTPYGDYHYNNAILQDNIKYRIGTKTANDKLVIARIRYNNVTLNIYERPHLELFIELKDKVIVDDITLTLMDNDKINYAGFQNFKKDDFFKYVRACYYDNGITFNSQACAVVVNEIMEIIR